MYIITEKENNLMVDYCDELVDNGDGSFLNVTADLLYWSNCYLYYEIDKIPTGVNTCQYFYTPEEGFKLAFSNLDVMKAQMATMEKEVQSNENFTRILNTYNKFQEEKTGIEDNLKRLSDDSLSSDERILLLESTVCDLYELILGILTGGVSNE